MLKEKKKAQPLSKNDIRERISAYLLSAPAVIMLFIFTVYPVCYLLYRSVFGGNLISKNPKFVGMENYMTLLNSEDFHQVLINTLIYTVIVVGITMVLAIIMAVWLNDKKHRRLNDFVQSCLFTPHIISIVSVSTLFLWLMDSNIGFFNSMLTSLGLKPSTFLASPDTALISLTLVMVWKSLGYYTLLIMAALQTVPTSVYEAAEVDDTPKLKVFFKITLPMISPTILFTCVVATIQSFRVFDTVSVMTQGGPVNSTNTLVYFIYQYAFRYSKPGLACAAGVVLLVFVCIVTWVQFQVGKTRVHYQ